MFTRLSGLPPYGPPARQIPDGWGHGVREGVVVEFSRADGSPWIGNFEPGNRGIDDVRLHPNGTDVLVISKGQPYRVNPIAEACVRLPSEVYGLWLLSEPPRVLFNDQDLAFFCLGREGLLWSSRRISWEGFQKLSVRDNVVEGEAWSPDLHWYPFRVNLTDGSVTGGSYDRPEMTFDRRGF